MSTSAMILSIVILLLAVVVIAASVKVVPPVRNQSHRTPRTLPQRAEARIEHHLPFHRPSQDDLPPRGSGCRRTQICQDDNHIKHRPTRTGIRFPVAASDYTRQRYHRNQRAPLLSDSRSKEVGLSNRQPAQCNRKADADLAPQRHRRT